MWSTVCLQHGHEPSISTEFVVVSNLISLSCPEEQMERQAESLGCAVLILCSVIPSAVLSLRVFTLALIYEFEICFKTFNDDKVILITIIGSLICSAPEGYAHYKHKQGVSVPYYAVVHFCHQS